MSENVLTSAGGNEYDDVSLMRTGFHAATAGTDDTIVLRLQGELDMATAPGLGRTLQTALAAGPSTLALDLRELTFVDSTGIRVLITACRQAGSEGCRCVRRAPSRAVRTALLLPGGDRRRAGEPGEGADES